MAKLVVAKKFIAEEEGATLVEYALLVALLVAASIALLYGLGRNVVTILNTTTTALSSTSNVITNAS